MWISAFAAATLVASGPTEPLAARVSAALANDKPGWVSWDVPAIGDQVACCWRSDRRSRPGSQRPHQESCSLDGNNVSMWNSREENSGLVFSGPNTLRVYVHGMGREVDRVQAFSARCAIEASGTVQHLYAVDPGQSVSFLSWLAKSSDSTRVSGRRSNGALTAIALHEAGAATPALEALASGNLSQRLRETAAFWLGNTRGQAGYEALVRLRTSSDAGFREKLTFSFSQSPAPEASTSLIDMAKSDPSPRVRGQALFWIAQKAQKKTNADVIRTAAVDDPDEDVKKKAVFALSQIPGGEGVPDLIRVAREHKSREVRKQAMFWLGQSKDPRALAFFEKILAR